MKNLNEDTAALRSVLSGQTLRDKGIKQALNHAEEKIPGWTKKAYSYLLRCPLKRFRAEEVREWCIAQGLPKPPHNRAWGGVFLIARRKGLIRQVGVGQVSNPLAHCANAAIWEKT